MQTELPRRPGNWDSRGHGRTAIGGRRARTSTATAAPAARTVAVAAQAFRAPRPPGCRPLSAGSFLPEVDAGASKIERVSAGRVASRVSPRLVAKNAAASPAVTRVRKLAAPRPVMKPPPPPMPSAPPSERCSSTTPTSAAAIMRWRMSRTVIMRSFRAKVASYWPAFYTRPGWAASRGKRHFHVTGSSPERSETKLIYSAGHVSWADGVKGKRCADSPPPCGEGLGVGGIPTFDVLQSPLPVPPPRRVEDAPPARWGRGRCGTLLFVIEGRRSR